MAEPTVTATLTGQENAVTLLSELQHTADTHKITNCNVQTFFIGWTSIFLWYNCCNVLFHLLSQQENQSIILQHSAEYFGLIAKQGQSLSVVHFLFV